MPIIGRSWEFSANNVGYVNFLSNDGVILFHFNPRSNAIVLNTWTNGWQREEYMYNIQYPMNIKIKITNFGFEISINGSIRYTYNHRHNINTFSYLDTNYQLRDTT